MIPFVKFVGAYLAIGLLLLGCIGGPRSKFGFTEPPSFALKFTIVLIWPLILVAMGGSR